MAARREKGLCFNCDERFRPGHKCRSKFLLMIADDEDLLEMKEEEITEEKEPGTQAKELLSLATQAQISFHALSGCQAPETLRMVGRISNHQVIVLVDGGSTHNFVQERMAKFSGLTTQPTHSLRVMVGNGSEIECHQICMGVLVHVQGQIFKVDLYVLPLSGADIVFGVQWLKSLGPVLTDYNTLSLKFVKARSLN
ncbi:Aspartic peptidase domain superfamily [Sesbania bispinosa]|nr:Aspartic peptidase domain superfamily [Sesbania bispinosa]